MGEGDVKTKQPGQVLPQPRTFPSEADRMSMGSVELGWENDEVVTMISRIVFAYSL